MITYEQALTQVVQANGWNSLQEFEFNEMRTSVIHSLTKEAAEFYANSKVEEYQRTMTELAQQLKEMTTVATMYKEEVEELKIDLEEEKKFVWDRACEAQRVNCARSAFGIVFMNTAVVNENSILTAPKPEYKP